MIFVEVDHSNLLRANDDLARAMGRDAVEVAHETLRALSSELPNFTPGFGIPGAKGLTNQIKVTRRSVDRDLDRLSVPIDALDMVQSPMDPKLGDRLRKIVRTQDAPAARALFGNMRRLQSVEHWFPDDLSAIHRRVRTRRGKVARSIRNIVGTSKRADSRLRRERVGNIGAWKAGWVPSMRTFGAPVPAKLAKVARRAGSSGYVVNDLASKNPGARLVNNTPFNLHRGSRLMQMAVDFRAGKTRRRADFLLKQRAREFNRRGSR